MTVGEGARWQYQKQDKRVEKIEKHTHYRKNAGEEQDLQLTGQRVRRKNGSGSEKEQTQVVFWEQRAKDQYDHRQLWCHLERYWEKVLERWKHARQQMAMKDMRQEKMKGEPQLMSVKYGRGHFWAKAIYD
ncbi:hypothetical protein C8J55DRAFT_484141 [Lentinula edodes]|uniref:Uncharacterized protein n=1 Tax=Lentinula lateritia TaxID=40482 RepID=A0A9W9B5N6_9AGAR|nr:hypothetical protein C8J55DRAFT_484141 [Lentinula edodes]